MGQINVHFARIHIYIWIDRYFIEVNEKSLQIYLS